MIDDLQHILTWHNGDKTYSPFSDDEMVRRQRAMRVHMAEADVDATIFTSYHNICYFSGFMYCAFGRRFAFVLTAKEAVTVTPAIDGGQPWRRSFADNVTYTDWRRENYFRALRQRIGTVKRLGIEFDHVNLDLRKLLEETFPEAEFVDLATAAMGLRAIKSNEEHDLIREGARICGSGARLVLKQ